MFLEWVSIPPQPLNYRAKSGIVHLCASSEAVARVNAGAAPSHPSSASTPCWAALAPSDSPASLTSSLLSHKRQEYGLGLVGEAQVRITA
jgi:hypothetical protein